MEHAIVRNEGLCGKHRMWRSQRGRPAVNGSLVAGSTCRPKHDDSSNVAWARSAFDALQIRQCCNRAPFCENLREAERIAGPG